MLLVTNRMLHHSGIAIDGIINGCTLSAEHEEILVHTLICHTHKSIIAKVIRLQRIHQRHCICDNDRLLQAVNKLNIQLIYQALCILIDLQDAVNSLEIGVPSHRWNSCKDVCTKGLSLLLAGETAAHQLVVDIHAVHALLTSLILTIVKHAHHGAKPLIRSADAIVQVGDVLVLGLDIRSCQHILLSIHGC